VQWRDSLAPGWGSTDSICWVLWRCLPLAHSFWRIRECSQGLTRNRPRAIQPIGAQEATPEPIADTADKTVSEDIAEPEDKTDQIERAVQEPDPPPDQTSDSAPASASASASTSQTASTSASTPAVAPANTTMYLSVPAMGISDIPVVEGTTEATSHFKNYPDHLP
jgi:hypothetical protein